MGPFHSERILMGLPCSFRSLFHGLSLLAVMLLSLGVWVALWQINYHEHYRGRSDCFAGNTIGLNGGGDNFLYCPNTHIVQNVNISYPYLLSTYSYNTSAEHIPLLNTTNNFYWDDSIYIEGDDDENWWLNFNPGTSVHIEFTKMNASVPATLFIDDDDAFVIPPGNSSFTFSVDTLPDGLPSRGYNFRVHSTTDVKVFNTVGWISFNANQTAYDPKDSTAICETGILKSSCLYEYDFGEDGCVLFVSGGTYQNYGAEYCPVIQQAGRDRAYMGVLIPVTVVIVLLILVVNIILGLWWEHRTAKYASVHY